MNTNVIDFESQSKLKQRAARIGAKLAAIHAHQKGMRQAWFDVADEILGARVELPNDQDFGRWWMAQEWADDIGPENRAACIVLALNQDRCRPLAALTRTTSPRYMLEFIIAIIKETGTEPLKEWREVLLATKPLHQTDDLPQAALMVASNQALTPEPTCEKSAPVEVGVPSEASPPAPRASSRPAVSGKNAAIAAWGDIGAQILGCFSDPHSRGSWNQLAARRHGIEVAKFALAYFERAGISLPTNATIKSPNARLVLPWLNSPFADEYDLRKAAGFQKLKDNFDLIERACRPYFDTHGHDRGNRCFDLYRREWMRPAELERLAQVEKMRERERKVINVKNHPAILVYGEELWPDGDLPENLRLDYDAARFAYFHWFDMEACLMRGEPKVSERAAFWKSRQASLHRLNFPVGAALSYFWWRAGEAMAKNPDAHMKSSCQPSLNIG